MIPNGSVLFEEGLRLVAICSVLHTVLPPWDFLNDFPVVQKYYKTFVYVVGYIALNGRSTLYQSISTKNGNGKPNGTPVPSVPSTDQKQPLDPQKPPLGKG